ncbi:AAA family ATPase [Varibaculum vaginae]|uniref:AAA family ATPase n=1 Tax=Varibaculum vaginae TaxID=2364797 RepID=UPI000F08060A|nr:MoxR family ATPase [Varibaculum vaginae]
MILKQTEAADFSARFAQIAENVDRAILGKGHQVRLVLAAFLAGGHVLLEDAPGTGKTALARALAASVTASHSRIQFTPDMLPTDITGVTVYDQKTKQWDFHAGPIFANIVLADEINRASPKTQSALLEVMEERQVSVDGVVHPVGSPFLVIATQNPVEQAGTYKLPEAQLDRFLIKVSLGYPDRETTVKILSGASQPDLSKDLNAVVKAEEITALGELGLRNYVDEQITRYVQQLAEATRSDDAVNLGVSTRAAIGMMRMAKVWAASQGRHYVLPDDIKTLAVPVWAHRIIMDADALFEGASAQSVVERALNEVPPPVDSQA